MSKRRVYQLVPARMSEDTIEVLEVLLHRARRGQLIGIAYVVMYKGRTYTAGAAGECRRNPTFTRGMVAHLNDALGRLIVEDDS